MSISPIDRSEYTASHEDISPQLPRELGVRVLHEVMEPATEAESGYNYIEQAILGSDTDEWKDHAREFFAQPPSEIIDPDKFTALGKHLVDGANKSKPAIQAIDRLQKLNEKIEIGAYADSVKLHALAKALFSKQPASFPVITVLAQRLNSNEELKDLTPNQVTCLAVGIINTLIEKTAESESKTV